MTRNEFIQKATLAALPLVAVAPEDDEEGVDFDATAEDAVTFAKKIAEKLDDAGVAWTASTLAKK